MHQEAQKIIFANNFLKGKLRWHVDELVEEQTILLAIALISLPLVQNVNF